MLTPQYFPHVPDHYRDPNRPGAHFGDRPGSEPAAEIIARVRRENGAPEEVDDPADPPTRRYSLADVIAYADGPISELDYAQRAVKAVAW